MEEPMRYFSKPILHIVIVVLWSLLCISCGGDPAAKRDKHMQRGDAYFNSQEYRKAIIEYKNAIQADPKYAQAHYQLAQAYLKASNPQQAFVEFSRTVDLAPHNLDAQLKLGQFYLIGRNLQQAREKADVILQKEPDNVDALFLKVGILLQEEKFPGAEDVLKKIMAIDKYNVKAHISLARIAASRKEFEKARQYLYEAKLANPRNVTISLEMVRFLEQQGETNEAEEVLLATIEENPDNPALLNQLGTFYVRTGDLSRAEAAFLKMAEEEEMDREKVESNMTVGAFYASQQDWKQAIAWMEKALALQPENEEIRNAVAGLYMNSGNHGEARRLVDSILERNQNNVGARFLKARLLLHEKELPEATNLLEGVSRDQPESAEFHYYLGLAYTAQNERKRAKDALQKAVQYNTENLKARILLAQVYLSERSPDLALEQTRAILAKDPAQYQALAVEANAHLQKEDLAKARRAFLEAINSESDNPTLYYQLALLDRREGRHDQANKNLDKALVLNPGHIPSLAVKVSLFMAQQQFNSALSFLEQKIQDSDKDPSLVSVLHEIKGSVLYAQKDYDASEKSFKNALSLNPDLVAPYLSLARLYLAKDETQKAIKQYREVLEKQPNFLQAHMALGAIYDTVGDTAMAQEAYEKALEIKPDFAPAANNLAWLLLQHKNDPNRALVLAKTAKSALPNDPSVADTIGLAYLENGFYPSAISEFSDAAEKMPHNATIWYHLGLAYWKNNEPLRALEAANKALTAENAFPERQQAEMLVKKIKASQNQGIIDLQVFEQ